MKLEQAHHILSLMTYKPGWACTLWDEGYELMLRMSMHVRDVQTGRPTTVGNVYPFGRDQLDMMNESDFVNMVRMRVLQLEAHETDEWLKIDGEHVCDPHPEMNYGAPKQNSDAVRKSVGQQPVDRPDGAVSGVPSPGTFVGRRLEAVGTGG